MAYPGSPPKGPAPFENPLTPADFDRLERLATSFRPSWELDEAPFTGAGTLSAGDIRALQGGGTHVDVRAALATAQASHAPAKPAAALDEPANKVIVDPSLVAPPMSARPDRPNPASSAGPWAASTAMPPLATAGPARASNRPPAPTGPAGTVPSTQRITARPPRPAFATEPSLSIGTKKSKMGLVLGAAGAAVVLVGGVMWLASGGSDKPVAAPVPTETTAEKVLPSIPPPPPETVAANAAPPASAAARPVAMSPVPVIAATALPQAPAASPPPARAAMATPAPHPAASPAPAPKPATASRPKGPTIVRDVPF
jgi:hypothetical protein